MRNFVSQKFRDNSSINILSYPVWTVRLCLMSEWRRSGGSGSAWGAPPTRPPGASRAAPSAGTTRGCSGNGGNSLTCVTSTGCRPPPPSTWGKEGRNKLNDEITPLLPSRSNSAKPNSRTCSALAPMWTPPINESAELTRGGPLVNSLLWGNKAMKSKDGTYDKNLLRNALSVFQHEDSWSKQR